MLNKISSGTGKRSLNAKAYRARIVSLGIKTAKEMSCEPSYKRQRVGVATEDTQHPISSPDGVMTPSQQNVCIPSDVYHRELANDSQVDRSSPNNEEEEKVGANESGASHDQSPLVVQGSSKSLLAGLSIPRFREYWVPIQLTDIQLEQYCSTLITKSALLCSPTKKGRLETLQNVIRVLRECCDHPYVLDANLPRFRKERCPSVDCLSIGIQASGKLQLLSKFLPKIREQGLRVLIVYKTISSATKKSLGIGDILDDFICETFGQESYLHIYSQRYLSRKEKQAAVDFFNDKTSGRFVVLTEYSSAQSSIRLPSVDAVILFNSDLNPVSDTRALQRMSLHTENDHLKVLRLYSLCTLEEKALCMAWDGSAVNCNRQYISANVCRKLLTWGAAYLFNKLDVLHASDTSESTKSGEDEFNCSVLHELSTLFSSNVDDASFSWSVISDVNKVGEDYSGNINLHGETEAQSQDDVPSHVIWSSLLHGRSLRWRFLPNEPESKRRFSSSERPIDMPEGGLRETGLLHEEIPRWYRGTDHPAKRSKRVPGCTLGFQRKIQQIRRRWYNDSNNIKKVDETQEEEEKKKKKKKKRSLKLKRRELLDNMHHLERNFITEICGESYRKLMCKKLDDGNLYEPDLPARNNEEEMGFKRIEYLENSTEVTLLEDSYVEIDAPSNSVDLRNLDTWSTHSTPLESESAIDILEPPIQELSPRERLNMENGNDLSHDVEMSTDSFLNDLPHETPLNCWDVEEATLQNPQTISDGQSLKESGHSTCDGFVLHNDFDIFNECLSIDKMIVAIGSDNENIYVRSVPVVDVLSHPISPENLNESDCVPPLSESELGANILENAVSCSLSTTENQDPLFGMQKSQELAVPSDTMDFHDTSYGVTLIDDEQISLQQCIDQSHQLSLEKRLPTKFPCSEITVTEESLPPPSCENVGNGACSQPPQSSAGASLIPDTSGLFDSSLMQTDNNYQPANPEPLQTELDKIQNTMNVETKKHEYTVLQLKDEREKEIAQVSQKYALLFQNAKNVFLQKKEELKVNYKKIKSHKQLAEAWTMDIYENSPMFHPLPPVQSTYVQTNAPSPYPQSVNQFSGLISTNQIVLPPYPAPYQNLCNSEAGFARYAPYVTNPYLYQLNGYPLYQSVQHPLNLSSSSFPAAAYYGLWNRY